MKPTALVVVASVVASSSLATHAFVALVSRVRVNVVPPESTPPPSLSSSGSLTLTRSSAPPLFPLPRTRASTAAAAAIASDAEDDDNILETTFEDGCDVLVLGSGPSARAIATLLASPADGISPAAIDVLLADANYDRSWIPNYGVWEDEWEAVRDLFSSFRQPLGPECIDRQWPVTDCFFGGSFDLPVENRMRLDRPYCRVDKNTLRRTLSPAGEVEAGNDGEGHAGYRVLRANHVSQATGVNIFSPAGSMVHDGSGTTLLLRSKDGGQVTRVRAKIVVDCTGHESRLVLRDNRVKSIPPGFQIAYGCLATVDESNFPDVDHVGPYYKEAMTLFDYRTDHFLGDSDELSRAERAPTFMYVMPLEGNRIFFEETSLVARPAVSFRECKERCATRLKHLGIKVTDIEEEEYCYIPMGGGLPAKDQRVVGFGGAAAMVHPSTGYHLCRAMMGAGHVAGSIRDELGREDWDPDRAAARAYDAIWSPANIAQRNFAVFGGEFLMKQGVEGLRGFFDGFFKLPLPLWGGFLAGWPGLPNNKNHENWWARLVFGLMFVSKLPLPVAFDMLLSIASYTLSEGAPLPQSVTPLLGLPEGYGYRERPREVGDVAAKAEARDMIGESAVENVIPVDFV